MFFNSKSILKFAIVFALSWTQFAYADWQYGIDTNTTYTRWYEYPGTYWEATFQLQGVRAENVLIDRKSQSASFGFGYGGTVYLAGDYKNSAGKKVADAKGLEADVFGQVRLPIGRGGLFARGGFSFLGNLASGSGTSGVYRNAYTVTVPLLFGGVGAEFALGDTGRVTALYHFALANLGIATDTYAVGTPSLQDWSSNGISILFSFGM